MASSNNVVMFPQVQVGASIWVVQFPAFVNLTVPLEATGWLLCCSVLHLLKEVEWEGCKGNLSTMVSLEEEKKFCSIFPLPSSRMEGTAKTREGFTTTIKETKLLQSWGKGYFVDCKSIKDQEANGGVLSVIVVSHFLGWKRVEGGILRNRHQWVREEDARGNLPRVQLLSLFQKSNVVC